MTKPQRSASKMHGEAKGMQPPLLVHFDVNKTVIQADSIQMKGIEDGVREGIAELFWGYSWEGAAHSIHDDSKLVWEWLKDAKPSCYPPTDDSLDPSRQLMTYFEYCRQVVKDRDKRKQIIKTFKLVPEDARTEMDKLLHVVMKKMELPPEVRHTKEAEDAGLKGSTVGIFPTLFHFVAALQRSKRRFAILFRSFGADHEKIKCEWNAFCEMRHPVYSKFIEGVGPLDGTVPGVPDRRIHSFHTVYRDNLGDLLILDTFTNGPNEKSWDSWCKTKPKPKEDTRCGREYVKDVLQAEVVDGLPAIRDWMDNLLQAEHTSALKDDWAWWQFHDEKSHAGKLLTLFEGDSEQLFFDDNIDVADSRIVDCRAVDGRHLRPEEVINKICTKVNPVEAILDDGYFLRKLQVCHGEHLDMGASLIDFQRQMTDLEDQKTSLNKKVKALTQQLKTLTDENRNLKLLHRINVRSESHLRDILAHEYDLEIFGKNGYMSISDLHQELEQGYCWLESDENGKIVRSFEMCFIKIQFTHSKSSRGPSEDIVLVETHEQRENADGSVQSRNYLPGIRKGLNEPSFQNALQRFMESSLGANITACVIIDSPPVYCPESRQQQTTATQAYPIPCKLQQSEATLLILSKVIATHQDLLLKIGLPAGKHFTTVDQAVCNGGNVTHFLRWEKIATWEASLASASGVQKVHEIDVGKVIDKLFRTSLRREAYENLLLQMFEVFTANKLCGGFSGSIVIRVQPFEQDGRPGEPCIVKLDTGDAIRDEFQNSENVFKALPDRAARILGDAVYFKNKKSQEEFGAMRLELAGACWNVPELAQGSASLLCTFKDLLLYESEALDSTCSVGGERPFGNMLSVLAETFGPGGVVASLRTGGLGLRRAQPDIKGEAPLLWGWYTLKGKETEFNPYTAGKDYPPEPKMRELYKQYFGEEMPDLKELVVGTIKTKLQDLGRRSKTSLFPLIALGHGDLNAANIMIDALDAVWLIDFATSVDLPLFTDMCKFEMACLFEYSTIPITPRLLLDFASSDPKNWKKMNVGDWLRVDQDVAELFMDALAKKGQNKLQTMRLEELHQLIDAVIEKADMKPHKKPGAARSIKSRLCTDEAEMACAFSYCKRISQTLLQGDYVFETLSVNAPQPDAEGERGAMSLRFFMDVAVSIRRFMFKDLMGCLREHGGPNMEGLQPADALSLQIWLPILRESFRLCGYRDITPQHKIWSIYHCKLVAHNVLQMLNNLEKQFDDLGSMQIMSLLRSDLAKKQQGAENYQRRLLLGSHWL